MEKTRLETTESGFGGFGKQRVVFFESRRATEMASLVERHGGVPVAAPSMREVTLASAPPALELARRLAAGSVDILVLMTGVGTRALAEEVAPVLDRASFSAALARVPRVVARGPKPAQALRELGLAKGSFEVVPEPNTWREVAQVLASKGELRGARVAVQEHGAPSTELYRELEASGAEVLPVAVYKWALPEDTGPLRAAILELAEGRARIALFTSRAQVDHVFQMAADLGVADALRETLLGEGGLVASIGPVCSEALRGEGITPHLEPSHPKMGHLVKEAAERAGSRLAGNA